MKMKMKIRCEHPITAQYFYPFIDDDGTLKCTKNCDACGTVLSEPYSVDEAANEAAKHMATHNRTLRILFGAAE